MPFINKTLLKEIMKRSKLNNRFLKDWTDENKNSYQLQRNYCVALLCQTKKEYYGNLDEKKVSNNNIFWKKVKPFYSKKIVSREQNYNDRKWLNHFGRQLCCSVFSSREL